MSTTFTPPRSPSLPMPFLDGPTDGSHKAPPPTLATPNTPPDQSPPGTTTTTTTTDPPLPSPARSVVILFRARASTSTHPAIAGAQSRPISRAQLDLALQHIQKRDKRAWRHLQAKERWEYRSGVLHLRMPSRFHEALSRALSRGIEARVEQAILQIQNKAETVGQRDDGQEDEGQEAGGLVAAETARGVWSKIAPTGCSHVKVHDGDELSPDESWAYAGEEVPTFLLEVAWSQKLGSLHDKAEQYILETRGRVRTVLAISATYTAKPKATPEFMAFMYRYHLEDGQFEAKLAPETMPIVLSLADFIPYRLTLQDAALRDMENVKIELDSAFFTNAVQVALDVHSVQSSSPLPDAMALAQPKKRKREEPSPSLESIDGSFEATSDDSFAAPKRPRNEAKLPRRSSARLANADPA